MTSHPAAHAYIATPADAAHTLIRCDNCGRHGWHPTERCPEGAGNGGDPILWFHEPVTDTPAELADIAPPAGAEHVADWVDETGDDGKTWGRYVRGTRRATAGVEIVVCGWQDSEGNVERHGPPGSPIKDTPVNATGCRLPQLNRSPRVPQR